MSRNYRSLNEYLGR